MRKHGFQWPPNHHQIGAIFALIVLVTLYYALLAPAVALEAQRLAFQLSYASIVAGLVSFLVAATWTDARDFGDNKPDFGGPIFHCPYCQLLVKAKTKHCKRCDKCVEQFDHHCVWLNNCIGGRNYWMFAGCLVCAQTAAALHLALSILLLVRCLVSADTMQQHLSSQFGGHIHVSGMKAVAGVNIGLSAAVSADLAELTLFHVYLAFKGISTYEHIVKQRQKARQQWCGRHFSSTAAAHVHIQMCQQRHGRLWKWSSNSVVVPAEAVLPHVDEASNAGGSKADGKRWSWFNLCTARHQILPEPAPNTIPHHVYRRQCSTIMEDEEPLA